MLGQRRKRCTSIKTRLFKICYASRLRRRRLLEEHSLSGKENIYQLKFSLWIRKKHLVLCPLPIEYNAI